MLTLVIFGVARPATGSGKQLRIRRIDSWEGRDASTRQIRDIDSHQTNRQATAPRAPYPSIH